MSAPELTRAEKRRAEVARSQALREDVGWLTQHVLDLEMAVTRLTAEKAAWRPVVETCVAYCEHGMLERHACMQRAVAALPKELRP